MPDLADPLPGLETLTDGLQRGHVQYHRRPPFRNYYVDFRDACRMIWTRSNILIHDETRVFYDYMYTRETLHLRDRRGGGRRTIRETMRYYAQRPNLAGNEDFVFFWDRREPSDEDLTAELYRIPALNSHRRFNIQRLLRNDVSEYVD